VDSKQPPQTQQQALTSNRRPNWPTQLIMTTSGLGVALSDSSLKSLKACLGLLRSATTHIDSVTHALKLLLEEYEAALQSERNAAASENPNHASSTHEAGVARLSLSDSQSPATADREAQVRRLADKMKSLSSDIWKTLQGVVQSVDRYTGGALPQNASQVVRTQLLSVPHRWIEASRQSQSAEEGRGAAEEVRGAKRMMAFAREGVDMMAQISTVVDGTVRSAEVWLGRMGRGQQGRQGQQQQVEEGEKNGQLQWQENGQIGEKR